MNISRHMTSLQHIPHLFQADCVVIGAGIAGLFTALRLSRYADVTLITKKSLIDSNTQWAQGGIAAVTSEVDTPALHMQDTLMAGAGLCDPEAVHVLVHEGPYGVKKLIQYGVHFDEENGEIALTKEGAHSRRRILHAQGDATGAEIVRGLSELVKTVPNITVLENHFVAELLTDGNQCFGIVSLNSKNKKVLVQAKAVVLATGGTGQLFRYTTNPLIATGDGISLAYRAGAEIQDMEFIQFHPTALYYPGAPRFLISEAVRGEGAVLRNTKGEPFMQHYHELGDLAPRDIVARAIVTEIEKTGSQYVYLDFTHESEDKIKHRFPTIYHTCLRYGLNMVHDWIPVAPAAHYTMGGVKTNLSGETNINGLYACGEVACTGVHGANRLASNSLSEAIVFGQRIAQHIVDNRLNEALDSRHLLILVGHQPASGLTEGKPSAQVLMEKRITLQKKMLKHASLTRSLESLQEVKAYIEQWLNTCTKYQWETKEALEFTNLLICSYLVVHAALRRTESRGGHYRLDFPKRNDSQWLKHLIYWRDRETGQIKERMIDVSPAQMEKAD